MSEYLKNQKWWQVICDSAVRYSQWTKNSGPIPREWLAVTRLRNGPLTARHNNGRPEHFRDAQQPSAMQKNSVARSLATREKTDVSSKNTATSTDAAHVTSTSHNVPLNITRLHLREALLLSVFFSYCVYRPGRLAASNLTAINCSSGKFKKKMAPKWK